MCIGYYGNAIASLCWHKNNNNSNTDDVLWHDNVLPSHWIIIIIMDFVLWGSIRNEGSWNVWLYSVPPSPLVSTLKEGSILAVHCIFPFDLQFAATHACFCKDIYYDAFTFYVAWECEKATLNPIWPVRLKLKLNRFPNHIWMKLETDLNKSDFM